MKTQIQFANASAIVSSDESLNHVSISLQIACAIDTICRDVEHSGNPAYTRARCAFVQRYVAAAFDE